MNALAWISAYLVVLGQAADDNGGNRLKESSQQLAAMMRASAEYEVRLETSENKLRMQTEPALRWTNPVRGTTDGAVFLWLANGRPEAAIGIYKWSSKPGEPDMEHELTSLSLGKLTAIRGGRLDWEPSKPRIESKAIPGAAAPAESAALRLRQMRALAREFTAFHNDEERPSEELRLLTQPIYHSESEAGGSFNGALFAFVQGTDPEVLLLIEARGDETVLAWNYGLARMTSRALKARHKDREVWTATNCWAQVTDRQESYTAFFRQVSGSAVK
jgi:hypothetical protein